MKISIVVPVYNAIDSLPILIDTLVNQTIKDIEIILVDNNSKDDSYKYMKECAKKDKRIKVLKETMQGPNYARKAGFDQASGEFIYFCDADDFISKDALEIMSNKMIEDSADIVIGNYNELGKDLSIKKTCSGTFYKDNTGNLKRYEDIIHIKPALWNKLFRKKIIKEDSFITSKIGEDMVIVLTSFLMAKEISYVDHVVYNYIPDEFGLTNSVNPKNLLDITVTCDALKNMFKKYDKNNSYNDELEFLMFTHVIYRILRSQLITDKPVRNDVYTKLSKYLKTLNYKSNKYYKKKIHYRLANFLLANKYIYNFFLTRWGLRFLMTNKTLFKIFKLLDK